MPTPIAKLLPTATLIVVFGYLTWSYLETAPTAGPPASQLPQIATALLKPSPPDDTPRDPFGESVRFALTPPKKDEVPAPKGVQPGDKPSQGAKTAQGTVAARGSGPSQAADQSPAKTTETRTAAGGEVHEPPAHWVLNGTVLRGAQSFAMINGRDYRAGERVEVEPSGPAWTLAEIQHHRVMLSGDQKVVELKFADPAANVERSEGSPADALRKLKAVRPQSGSRQPPKAPPRRRAAKEDSN